MSRYGRISRSLMKCQMMRVISSPSSSTTGFATLIFAMNSPVSCGGLEIGDVGLFGPYRLCRLVQGRELALGQLCLHHLLHATRTDLRLDAEVDATDAVFAVDPGADRHDSASVFGDRLRHPGRRRRRRVVRRPGLK